MSDRRVLKSITSTFRILANVRCPPAFWQGSGCIQDTRLESTPSVPTTKGSQNGAAAISMKGQGAKVPPPLPRGSPQLHHEPCQPQAQDVVGHPYPPPFQKKCQCHANKAIQSPRSVSKDMRARLSRCRPAGATDSSCPPRCVCSRRVAAAASALPSPRSKRGRAKKKETAKGHNVPHQNEEQKVRCFSNPLGKF